MGRRLSKGQDSDSSPVYRPSRKIPELTRLLLFTRAGGRCEFDGCNDYLIEHHLTLTEGNFAQLAHIVAFSEDGPRGTANRPDEINDPGNLMVLCHRCHKLIDDNSEQYPVLALRAYKQRHEDRIKHVTGLDSDRETTVVQLKSNIGGHDVAIPIGDVTLAVSPRYPRDTRGCIIDLTGIKAEGPSFFDLAKGEIRSKVQMLYEPCMDAHRTRHISLFALAPIPLLIYLGSQLSNKVPVDLYQRHRDTESWAWKTGHEPVQFVVKKLRDSRSDKASVGLLLSLSGVISPDRLSESIDDSFDLYEISPVGIVPHPELLRVREDLENFRAIYQRALRMIIAEHTHLEEIHLFPAVPAPAAIVCGRELLHKHDPSLLVYDFQKNKGGFQFSMKVN